MKIKSKSLLFWGDIYNISPQTTNVKLVILDDILFKGEKENEKKIYMVWTLPNRNERNSQHKGQPTATALSREAKEYCLKNSIPLPPNKAPTDVIMLLTGKNMDYYHDKMVMEAEAIQLQNTIRQ